MNESVTTAEAPSRPAGTPVEIRGITLRAGGRVLLQEAEARFEPGQVTLIVGPSGVGKSLLLRVLAGLLGPSSDGEVRVAGSVTLEGREVLGSRRRRPVGVVFQSFALFDELSPVENVRFARAHAGGRGAEASAPEALLEELDVPRGVRTASLSGGQRQRLAIARTLAYGPDVILYDEPTSGLDAATAEKVAALIGSTHATHPKTSIIVTHDYESLAGIADAIYLLDPQTRSLRKLDREDWPHLRELLHPAPTDDAPPLPAGLLRTSWRGLSGLAAAVAALADGTTRAVGATLAAPLRLLPVWRSPLWGARYLLHYLRLVADPSAWLYLAIAGGIIGFVATYFTFKFLPFANYTEPLLIENLLDSLGFALYRILAPVLATILIAARCGAAVASDVGGKVYGQQFDALQTFGVRPKRYLLTGILYAFLFGAPVLVGISYLTAAATSVAVFAAIRPEHGADFWNLHFHRSLRLPGELLYDGTPWLLGKVLLCAAGIALVAYYRGARPKYSSRDVSAGITSTILYSTLWVLAVHFAFAFYEFE